MLVRLTTTGDNQIAINTDEIAWVSPANGRDGAKAIIYTRTSAVHSVRETFDDVVAMVNALGGGQ